MADTSFHGTTILAVKRGNKTVIDAMPAKDRRRGRPSQTQSPRASPRHPGFGQGRGPVQALGLDAWGPTT